MLGLGLLDRAGLVKVVEGGDLGADEALGQVGVDLAGGVDGGAAALEVPAADLGLARGEEGDDPDRVVGPADDPVAAELASIPRSAMKAARSSGSSWESSSSSLASMARASGASARSESGDSLPWSDVDRTPPGACRSSRPNDRSGFLSSSERPSEATVLPASSAAWTDLDDVELLELGARGRAGAS